MSKNFTAFLWGAPFIGSIGRSIYDISIIWLILDITNSEKLTGLIAMTTYLPAIFFGLFAGAIVDMYSKTRVMAFAQIMQAIAVIGIPIFLGIGIPGGDCFFVQVPIFEVPVPPIQNRTVWYLVLKI